MLTPSYAYLSSLTFVIVCPGYPRHPEMWLEDGNLVLVASHTTAFRVHRSVLARHAAVFADMFSLPQPPRDVGVAETESKDTYQGCPVVFLTDAAAETRCFLKAIHDYRCVKVSEW